MRLWNRVLDKPRCDRDPRATPSRLKRITGRGFTRTTARFPKSMTGDSSIGMRFRWQSGLIVNILTRGGSQRLWINSERAVHQRNNVVATPVSCGTTNYQRFCSLMLGTLTSNLQQVRGQWAGAHQQNDRRWSGCLHCKPQTEGY